NRCLRHAHDRHDLTAAERPGDRDLVARANRAMRLARLAVHRDPPGLAGLLGLGARAKEAFDVEPDVESDEGRLGWRCQIRISTLPVFFRRSTNARACSCRR